MKRVGINYLSIKHAKRRRMIGDRYANSNVMKAAPLAGIKERSTKFLQRCLESPDRTADVFVSCNVHHETHAWLTDMSNREVGAARWTHPAWYSSTTDQCLQHCTHMRVIVLHINYFTLMEAIACRTRFTKKWCIKLLLTIACRVSSHHCRIKKLKVKLKLKRNTDRLVQYYSPVLHSFGSKILASFAKPRSIPLADNFVIENAKENGAAGFTVLNRLKEKNSVLDTMDMAAECLDHMAAGIDTTGDVLCFLMWELSQPRSIKYQRLLRDEFLTRADASLDDLPMLDAVLNEGLRCFPAIPMSLPRYVPQGGRSIDGFFLPERTVVSCQAMSVHRINHLVFPEPDKFCPERWLETEGDADRRRHQWAFSSGGRGCIGKQ